MEEILHQLRLVVYPTIYKVLYIQTVVVWDFWTINSKAFLNQAIAMTSISLKTTAGVAGRR